MYIIILLTVDYFWQMSFLPVYNVLHPKDHFKKTANDLIFIKQKYS